MDQRQYGGRAHSDENTNMRKRLCQRRLQNIIRRHQNIIPTRLAITAKRPNIMTQHEKAAHHAHTARAHAIHARGHSEEAVKAHHEDHGKKIRSSIISPEAEPACEQLRQRITTWYYTSCCGFKSRHSASWRAACRAFRPLPRPPSSRPMMTGASFLGRGVFVAAPGAPTLYPSSLPPPRTGS